MAFSSELLIYLDLYIYICIYHVAFVNLTGLKIKCCIRRSSGAIFSGRWVTSALILWTVFEGWQYFEKCGSLSQTAGFCCRGALCASRISGESVFWLWIRWQASTERLWDARTESLSISPHSWNSCPSSRAHLSDHMTPLPWPLSDHMTPLTWPLSDHMTPLPWPLRDHMTSLTWPLSDHMTSLPWPSVRCRSQTVLCRRGADARPRTPSTPSAAPPHWACVTPASWTRPRRGTRGQRSRTVWSVASAVNYRSSGRPSSCHSNTRSSSGTMVSEVRGQIWAAWPLTFKLHFLH